MKIAIIPARGGSKRLPGKNIKLLGDKPLIAWTIDAAIKSKVFDHVFVSTDSEEIASIAKQYGAKVPFLRPSMVAFCSLAFLNLLNMDTLIGNLLSLSIAVL